MLLEVQNHMRQVELQSTMIINLVNDLMDVAKIQAFKFKLFEEYFDLPAAIADAQRTMQVQASMHEIKLSMQFKANFKKLKSNKILK